MSNSRPTHPRKGREGKGIGRDALEHASYLTDGAVDNPLATAATQPASTVECDGFAETGRWLG